MIYDFEMIEKVYENIVKNVDNARKSIKRRRSACEWRSETARRQCR